MPKIIEKYYATFNPLPRPTLMEYANASLTREIEDVGRLDVLVAGCTNSFAKPNLS